MGVLTKYGQIKPVYPPQSIVTYIYLHPVYYITKVNTLLRLSWALPNTFGLSSSLLLTPSQYKNILFLSYQLITSNLINFHG
jgi:hypothetical protein